MASQEIPASTVISDDLTLRFNPMLMMASLSRQGMVVPETVEIWTDKEGDTLQSLYDRALKESKERYT